MRHIGFTPDVGFFRPAGVPACVLEQVTLTLDEVEALRLADLDGLYQEQAAERMKISRPTFARIVEQARRKVADALIHGMALRLEGGAVKVKGVRATPARHGTGPAPGGPRPGPGPCGCGRRQGRTTEADSGPGACRGGRTNETKRENRIDKGERKS